MSTEEPEAGPYLDRLIELRVFGRKPTATVPSYSTDDSAAELVIAKLARPPLRWVTLQEEDQWTFHWREPVAAPPGAARYVRMVTAKAPTRPLAVCRAALKLLGPLSGPRATKDRSPSDQSVKA